jgi:ABC-type protease/lipase transport system fused ATPase/permease subunit
LIRLATFLNILLKPLAECLPSSTDQRLVTLIRLQSLIFLCIWSLLSIQIVDTVLASHSLRTLYALIDIELRLLSEYNLCVLWWSKWWIFLVFFRVF